MVAVVKKFPESSTLLSISAPGEVRLKLAVRLMTQAYVSASSSSTGPLSGTERELV